jgi:hypothetical protein
MKDEDLPGVARERLAKLNQNCAWLATQTGISRALVYAYMSTGAKTHKGLSRENEEKLFAALGLAIIRTVGVVEKKAVTVHKKPVQPPDMPL